MNTVARNPFQTKDFVGLSPCELRCHVVERAQGCCWGNSCLAAPHLGMSSLVVYLKEISISGWLGGDPRQFCTHNLYRFRYGSWMWAPEKLGILSATNNDEGRIGGRTLEFSSLEHWSLIFKISWSVGIWSVKLSHRFIMGLGQDMSRHRGWEANPSRTKLRETTALRWEKWWSGQPEKGNLKSKETKK